MKLLFFTLFFIMFSICSFGQLNSQNYSFTIKKADSLYKIKEFKASAQFYSNTFRLNNWQGKSIDYYNAACSYALAGLIDSSFAYLFRVANQYKYKNYNHIIKDSDLEALHEDKRWEQLILIVKENKEKAEINLNKPLVAELDSIHNSDQQNRKIVSEIEKKFGLKSPEVIAYWKIINYTDSINTIKIKSIIDKFGWLGSDVIGEQGNSTLFLVIQHADFKTQEKYLPVMQNAVKSGKASASSLALLEDRIATRQGKKQTYGSQIRKDKDSNQYYVLPIEDPDNVDKRRASIGLPPMSEYVNYWKITWDLDKYKKELVERELQKKSKE
jgi:hypothetical protein